MYCYWQSCYGTQLHETVYPFVPDFNSLWPSDAIWQHRYGSTLIQIMAWCLAAPSHYLNQCWLISSKVCSHSAEGDFTYMLVMTLKINNLTHWGRVTHICVSKLNSIGSDNGLSPGRCQAIIWTNAGILLIRLLRRNFNEILIEIHAFPFKKMYLKMSSGKWRPFCPGLNVLRWQRPIPGANKLSW